MILPKLKLPSLSEHEIQKSFIQICSLHAKTTMPLLSLIFSVPNGGLRSKATASKLKAEGVKAGIPDIIFPVPRGGFSGLAIEFKSKAGRTSPAQDECIASLRSVGWKVVIHTCQLAAFSEIKQYYWLPEIKQLKTVEKQSETVEK